MMNLKRMLASAAVGALLTGVCPLQASPYTVSIQGILTSVRGSGAFDNSVQVGTPFSFVFNWDTSIPPNYVSTDPYNYYSSWVSYDVANGATVRFGDYGSDPAFGYSRLLKYPITPTQSYPFGSPTIDYETGGILTGPSLAGNNLSFVTSVQLEGRKPGTGFASLDQEPQSDWNLTDYQDGVFNWNYYSSIDYNGNPSYLISGAITSIILAWRQCLNLLRP